MTVSYPLRSQPDRLSPPRRRPHRAVFLGLCPPFRRHLHPAHRRHRPRALDAGSRAGDPRRHAWLGLRPRRRPVLPDAAHGPLPRSASAQMLAAGTAYHCYCDAGRSSKRCASAARAPARSRATTARWRPEPGKTLAAGAAKACSRWCAFKNPARRRRHLGRRGQGPITISNDELDDLVIARAGRHADLQLLRRRRRLRHEHHARDPRRRPRQQHAAPDQHPARARRDAAGVRRTCR